MNFFSKKPTVEEQLKANDRVMRRTQRDLERDRNKMEKEEKKLEMEIKKAARQGNKQAATVLAKQLVNLRKQKNRSYATGSKIQAVGNQQKLMHSNMKMATAMGTTTKTMQQMNKVMDPQKTAKMMQDFEKESTKMGMTEEMINDTLDDILAESGDEEEKDTIIRHETWLSIVNDTLDDILTESGDEEEEDAIVTQVLDEIGIDITGKMLDAPSAHSGKLGEGSKSKASAVDDDIERQLAALKDL